MAVTAATSALLHSTSTRRIHAPACMSFHMAVSARQRAGVHSDDGERAEEAAEEEALPELPAQRATLRETMKGTRVMWLENDLWSTLCTSSETDACSRASAAAATASDGSPLGLPSGRSTATPDSERPPLAGGRRGRMRGRGAGRGVRAGTALGGMAHVGGAHVGRGGVAVVATERGSDVAREVLLGGCGGCADVLDGTAAPRLRRDLDMLDDGSEQMGSGVQERSGGHTPADVVEAEGHVGGYLDVDKDSVVHDESCSAEDSPVAMMRLAEVVRVAEQSHLEGAKVLRAGESFEEATDAMLGGTTTEVIGHVSPGHLTVDSVTSFAGQPRPKLSAGDLSAAAVALSDSEERVTVESLGEVIELPMVINPLPLMQYYEDHGGEVGPGE